MLTRWRAAHRVARVPMRDDAARGLTIGLALVVPFWVALLLVVVLALR